MKSFFSAKDNIPKNLKSFLVYKFICAGCNACYIGETARHFSVRINEHLKKDKSSNIYKYMRILIALIDVEIGKWGF